MLQISASEYEILESQPIWKHMMPTSLTARSMKKEGKHMSDFENDTLLPGPVLRAILGAFEGFFERIYQ